MLLQKPLVPFIEVRSLRYCFQDHWKAVWQPLITKDFDIDSHSLQSFCIGKGFVPQDINPCALYYYDIDRLAHQSVRKGVGGDAHVGGKPFNDFARRGE